MAKDNDYLPLIEAADMLGITRQWLRKRVQNGTAPAHITVGSRTIFERAAVEAEAKGTKQNSPAGGGKPGRHK